MTGHWRVFYILDDNRQVVATDDIHVWAEFMADDETDRRRVAFDQFPEGYISTVFLGIDLNILPGWGEPRCFETMAFHYRGDDELPKGIYQTRAPTWAEAERQHTEALVWWATTNGGRTTDDSDDS